MSRPTTVRLDEWQLEQLRFLRSLDGRPVSWHIQRAVDAYAENELSISRDSHERERRRQDDRALLASFTPKPFTMSLGEDS